MFYQTRKLFLLLALLFAVNALKVKDEEILE